MKKNRLFVLLVGTTLLAAAVTANASVYSAMHQADVSGNVQSTTNQYGSTVGGLRGAVGLGASF